MDKNPLTMTAPELAVSCQSEVDKARATALKILSPVQVVALESTGLRIVPEWMVRVMLGVLAKAPRESDTSGDTKESK